MRSVCLLLAIALLLAACSDGAPEAVPSPTDDAATTPAGGAEVAVSIVDIAFNPAEVTVPVGDTVVWTNGEGVPHTVTFEDGAASERLSQGDMYGRRFQAAGDFAYMCSFHPQQMTGTVTVE